MKIVQLNNIIKFACILLGIIFILPFTFAGEIDYSSYELVLKNNVKDGLVDYNNIKKNDLHLLEKYLEQLRNINAEYFDNLNSEDKIAFWINTYNAVTIYGIVSNYPVKYGGFIARRRFPQNSIRQIKDFWDTVCTEVMGKNITLNQIEHKILRKNYDEPRIHFALVCASMGCPQLSDEPYKGGLLNKQLNTAAKKFISNNEKVFIDTSENKLYVSSIFKWYAEDFPDKDSNSYLSSYNKKERGFIQFIVKHLDNEKRDYIVNSKPQIKYLDYDWSLNEIIQ